MELAHGFYWRTVINLAAAKLTGLLMGLPKMKAA